MNEKIQRRRNRNKICGVVNGNLVDCQHGRWQDIEKECINITSVERFETFESNCQYFRVSKAFYRVILGRLNHGTTQNGRGAVKCQIPRVV
jgi:hypothetical protein